MEMDYALEDIYFVLFKRFSKHLILDERFIFTRSI